jgi:Caspase domain
MPSINKKVIILMRAILLLLICTTTLRAQRVSFSWTVKPNYETPRTPSFSTSLSILDEKNLQHFLYNESFAALIIEGAYSTGGWQSVTKSANENEERLRKSLEQRGFDVLIWRDLDGTQLRTALNEIFINFGVRPMTRLFFYYYGHGYQLQTESEKSGSKSYLVPIGAANPMADELEFRRVALPVSQIVEYARQITVKHAFFALEACNAGAYAEYLGMPSLYPKGYLLAPQLQLPVRQILSAGNANQEVLADSHFTPLLIEALENADFNADGYVTGAEVMAYVAQKLPQMEKDQNPVPATIPRTGGGDFVFGPALPKLAPPQQGVPKPMIVTREWRSPELQVDCNRTNSGKIQVSIPLESAFNEKVVGVSAHYDRLDHVKNLTGPTVEGGPAQSVVVSYGFNGEDRNFLGNCPGGGHATIVVTFQVERTEVPIQAPTSVKVTIQ